MARPEERFAYEGLAAVAHAIRRSTAITVAMGITEPGTSEEDLYATADRVATWIGGRAVEEEATKPPEVPLGVPWSQRDQPDGG